MNSVIKECLSTSRYVSDNRSRLESFAHAAEELGELAEQVLIEEGLSYKQVDEGVIGEALDLIVCAVDLIYLTNPDITESQLVEKVLRKLKKWEDNFDQKRYEKQQETKTYVDIFEAEREPKFETVWLGDWSTIEGLEQEFSSYREPFKLADDGEILLAYYEYRDYSGECFVLFRQEGKLYSVEGSHCSCFGLEGQWEPTETDPSTLKHRLSVGRLGVYNAFGQKDTNLFAKELLAVLEQIENK